MAAFRAKNALVDEKVFFDNGHGITLCGVLVLPKRDAPIVLLCHGLGSRKDGTKMSSLIDPLAAAGIGSFRVDLFGHGESGGDFADLTLTRGVESVVAASRYLRSRFPHARLGVLGDSFGGGSVFYALPSLDVEGAVLSCPAILYFEKKRAEIGLLGALAWRVLGRIWYKSHSTGKRRPLKYAFYTSLAEHDGKKTAAAITQPVLIMHGDADQKVPYAQSVEIVKLLRHGTLSTFPGVDHYFREPAASERLVREAVGFFVKLFGKEHARQSRTSSLRSR